MIRAPHPLHHETLIVAAKSLSDRFRPHAHLLAIVPTGVVWVTALVAVLSGMNAADDRSSV